MKCRQEADSYVPSIKRIRTYKAESTIVVIVEDLLLANCMDETSTKLRLSIKANAVKRAHAAVETIHTALMSIERLATHDALGSCRNCGVVRLNL